MDRKREAAKLLSRGVRPSQVARSVGVHRSTVARWRSRREFMELLDSMRSAAPAVSKHDLSDRALGIVQLRAIASDPTLAPTARVRAAEVLVSLPEPGPAENELTQAEAERIYAEAGEAWYRHRRLSGGTDPSDDDA